MVPFSSASMIGCSEDGVALQGCPRWEKMTGLHWPVITYRPFQEETLTLRNDRIAFSGDVSDRYNGGWSNLLEYFCLVRGVYFKGVFRFWKSIAEKQKYSFFFPRWNYFAIRMIKVKHWEMNQQQHLANEKLLMSLTVLVPPTLVRQTTYPAWV